MRIVLSILAVAGALATASAASAATVTVNANANGQFGQLQSGGTSMVEGVTLSAGESITITATGTIGLGENLFTDANGIDVDSSSGAVFAFEYTPLEEASEDLLSSPSFNTLMPNLGALMGAFVAEDTVTAGGFSANDTDTGGGIAATSLFFVGTSLVFTASEDGTLFFGINEGYVSNNSGAYSVTIGPVSPVPLPAGLPLLGLGLAALIGLRKRAR